MSKEGVLGQNAARFRYPSLDHVGRNAYRGVRRKNIVSRKAKERRILQRRVQFAVPIKRSSKAGLQVEFTTWGR